MKKITILVLLLMLVVGLNKSRAQEQLVLNNIQKKIDLAVYRDNDIKQVNAMLDSLSVLQKKSNNSLLDYWKAYAEYNVAILYGQEEKKKDLAKKSLETGIKDIEGVKRKRSEDYALLCIMKGLELNYLNFLEVPFSAKKVEEAGLKAIELDSNNLRAQLAYGIYDFYTPKMFGGGKKVEKILKKAISLNDSYDSNPYAPTWGKDLAYSYLIRYYERIGEKQKAKDTYKESLEKLGSRPIIELFNPFKEKSTK
ncbi:MAG: hypothetical protein ACEPOW_05845 [Bacteroidales bacterium]